MIEQFLYETPDLNKFWQAFKDTEGFDCDAFTQLVEDTGEDTTLKIIARFTETLKEVESSLRQDRAEGASDSIWRSTHKVASSAQLIGFTRYGLFSRELSHQVRANPNLASYSREIESALIQTQALVAKINKTITNLAFHL